ncbi:PAS domain-containing protein [Candidatus Altiarchaeota archaeon]
MTGHRPIQDASNLEADQLREIFHFMDEPIYVSDPTTYEILYLNQSAKTIWGDKIGEKCHKAIHKQEMPCAFCTNHKIFGDSLGDTCTWESKNEVNGRWYKCIDHAIRWPDDRDVRMEYAQDITDLMNSQERYRQLLENMNSCVAVYEATDEGKDFRFKEFNWKAEEADGKKRSELLGEKLTQVFPNVAETGLLDALRKAYKTGESVRHQEKKIEDDEIRLWREHYIYKLQEGELVQVYLDLTEKKGLEEELEESRKRFDLAMESAAEGHWNRDLADDKVYYSPRWKSMLGYGPEEVTNELSEWLDRIHPEDKERAMSRAEKHIKSCGAEPFDIEYRMKHKQGHYVDIHANAFLAKNKDGRPVKMIGTHVDISERRNAEASIRDIEEELENKEMELKELNRFIVGRELDLMGFKEEVNGLLAELGQSPRYDTSDGGQEG